MKIIKKDLRHNKLVIKPETEDDLWVLEKIIQPGDLVSGKTVRSIAIERGDKREKVKKKIFAKITVEKVELNDGMLRVNGKIVEASEDVPHAHHSFEVEIGGLITIEKEWHKYHLDQLNAAQRKQPKILICVLDDESADFATLTSRISYDANIKGITGKSLGEQDKSPYYKEVINYLKEAVKRGAEKIIIAGPGFTKDNIMKLIKNDKDLGGKVFTDNVAHTGHAGIQEVLKRGIVDKILKNSAISEETRLVEQFFEELGKDGNVSYGKEEVKKAINMGAVEKLLISDSLIKDNEELMKKAEQMGAKVRIISTEHEAGKRLLNMGGFAAFLRYKLN
ncbi:MAG: mRNA surveillance protein pelota [Candidatus Aenigmarchaeota archaeon]|nr:mRNA surveillance protein pelota [Candidatus Aenigmarchaeota archaeon]